MSLLDDLVASTRRRVQEAKAAVPAAALEARLAALEPTRGFAAALTDRDEVALIAEIKRASPSKGPLNLDADAAPLAQAYADGGAAAISVLTIPDGFEGSLEDMAAVRGVGLPVLRKDFVLDPYQLFEARVWGADAVLLVVRSLGDELGSLVRGAEALGLDPLVEVHDERELDRALEADAHLIGVNHRDLETFDVDPDRTAKLAPHIPAGSVLVALSGVSERAQVVELAAAGARAVLVGEALMTADDPAAALRTLRGVA